MTVQKLSRREALRGTGVAALAAGASVAPLVGAIAEGLGRWGGIARLSPFLLKAMQANSNAEG
jgi:hypothetical protein